MTDPPIIEDTEWRCTICGRIGSVGRCCGLETREPLNDLAREEAARIKLKNEKREDEDHEQPN